MFELVLHCVVKVRPAVDNVYFDDARELGQQRFQPVADLGCRKAQIFFEVVECRDQFFVVLLDARLEIVFRGGGLDCDFGLGCARNRWFDRRCIGFGIWCG